MLHLRIIDLVVVRLLWFRGLRALVFACASVDISETRTRRVIACFHELCGLVNGDGHPECADEPAAFIEERAGHADDRRAGHDARRIAVCYRGLLGVLALCTVMESRYCSSTLVSIVRSEGEPVSFRIRRTMARMLGPIDRAHGELRRDLQLIAYCLPGKLVLLSWRSLACSPLL